MSFVCLAYHHVSDRSLAAGDALAVSESAFAWQMAWLARLGLRGVTVSEALKDHGGGNRIALSFDDGYQDFISNAWPVLSRYGFRATLFVVPGLAGCSAAWAKGDGSALMTWSQLRNLEDRGLEIGAHGLTHANLLQLSSDEAFGEMRRSRNVLAAHLAKSPDGIAYPYGDHDDSLMDLATRAGFRWAATSRSGRNARKHPFALRRTTIGRGETGRMGIIRFGIKLASRYSSWVDLRMDLRHV